MVDTTVSTTTSQKPQSLNLLKVLAPRIFGPSASASFSSASSWVGTTPRARAALSAL